MARRRNRSKLSGVNALIYIGLLAVFFAFGKGLIDLINGPPQLDLAADDQLQAGFLPVYAEEDRVADPQLVAIPLESADAPEQDSGEEQPQDQVEAFPTTAPELPQLPQPTPDPGLAPEQIIIPAIGLDASIIPIEFQLLQFEGKQYQQWLAPEYRAAGWHFTSVGLGVPGNTVINGHHNIRGEVFRDLYRLKVGDELQVYSDGQEFDYVIVYMDILPERNQSLDVRLSNSEWIQPTQDERVTLITCWPYESNTHRVVVVAVPVRAQGSG